jgi:GNAT superfamily N-acetyltransferase
MEINKIDSSDTNDYSMLLDMLSQQMNDIGSHKSISSIESSLQNALKPDSRAICFLAKQDNVPIGMVFMNVCSGIESGGDYVWINEIRILPDQRGKGYGKELLNHVLEWSKMNDIQTVLGVTGISNNASQALFESENFIIDDIKWMVRNL